MLAGTDSLNDISDVPLMEIDQTNAVETKDVGGELFEHLEVDDSQNQVLLHNHFQKILQEEEAEPKSFTDHCLICFQWGVPLFVLLMMIVVSASRTPIDTHHTCTLEASFNYESFPTSYVTSETCTLFNSSTTSYESGATLPSGTAVSIQRGSSSGRVEIMSPSQYAGQWCGDFKGVIQSSTLEMGSISIEGSETTLTATDIVCVTEENDGKSNSKPVSKGWKVFLATIPFICVFQGVLAYDLSSR